MNRVLIVELEIDPAWDDATVWRHLDAVIRLVEGVTPMEFVAGWWDSDWAAAGVPWSQDGRPRCSGHPAGAPHHGPLLPRAHLTVVPTSMRPR